MNQLCKVCGEPAAGYHFGAFTCEGCKSFFGRTYSNLSALGECKNNGQCVINKKNRTSCKSCRLKKCLVVGMSKSGSRYGRRSNWFKIHCLIQDQAEKANSKLDDSGSTCTSGTSLNPGSSPGSIPSPSSMEQKSNFLASLHNNNNHSKHNSHNNNNNNHSNNHVGSSRSERNHHGLATSLIPSPLSSNQQHRSSHHQTSLSPLLPGAGLNPSSLSPLLPFNYPSRFFFQNYGSPAAAAAMSAALFRGIMSGSAAAMGPLSTSSPFSPTSLSAPSPVDLSSALLEASSKAKKSRINDSDDEDMMMKEEEEDEEDVDVDDNGEEDRNDVGINPKIGTHRKSLMNHHRSTNHRFNNSSSHGHHGSRRNNNGQESPSSDSITEGEEEVDKPLDLTLK